LALLLPIALLVAIVVGLLGVSQPPRATSETPNLNSGIGDVKCATAQNVATRFTQAVAEVSQKPANYAGIEGFGFQAPVNISDIAPLKARLQTRVQEVQAKADTVTNGDCTDGQTAAITDNNGKTVILPLVSQNRPTNPLSGSQTNVDPRSIPVTIGTPNDHTRANNWTMLNAIYGTQPWYVSCANTNLTMNWSSDVPKYTATEATGQDSRFILAVNVSSSLTDDQVRARAQSDGNPNTTKLQVIRVASIINTRYLGDHRCDPFIDARSQIRVSLGKLQYDAKGIFKGIETTDGAFVDCHNLWRLPKTPPVPTPSPTPSSPSPTPSRTTPTTTPPTTIPSPTCTPPETMSSGGKCVQPKNGSLIPTPTVEPPGKNPPASQNPKPSDPPTTSYTPPPPPPPTTSGSTPAPTRTSVPPPPPSSNPTQTFDPCHPWTPACG
jgi:hypothetical protein